MTSATSAVKGRPRLGCPKRLLDQPSDIATVPAKIMLEPIGKSVRRSLHPLRDLLARHQSDFRNLSGIGPRVCRESPEIDIDEFVLVHAIVEINLVAREEAERKRARDTELLVEAPACRCDRSLAQLRVAAAGIRP